MSHSGETRWWNLELESMPHFELSMRRIYAWYESEIIDRPPVRFMSPEYTPGVTDKPYPSGSIQDKWFDVEFRVEAFVESIKRKVFRGETFPFFYPFIGVDAYASFYGGDLIFDDRTSWYLPCIENWGDVAKLNLDVEQNPYFRIAEQLTSCALAQCEGKFMVGYTSLHPGVDCAAAWRGHSRMCLDFFDCPPRVRNLIDLALANFQDVFEHFDAMLKAKQQLSISWLGVPSFTTMHIPGCDFAALISPHDFEEFCLPSLQKEAQVADQNIFHLDGEGVARHIDMILSVPEIDAVQWAQGMGPKRPIMQWIPLVKKIQARRPMIVDVPKEELEAFMDETEPEGLFLWVQVDDEEEELAILKRISRWA
jgi:hypothetical protein